MREIKFRGHRIDNSEVVKGSLLIEKVEVPVLKIDPIGEYKELQEVTCFSICIEGGTKDGKVWCEVDPETVGQYTGLIDANGVEIYEGDRLRCTDKERELEWTTVVKYQDTAFVIDVENEEYNVTSIGFIDFDYTKLEVTGNIHTNGQ